MAYVVNKGKAVSTLAGVKTAGEVVTAEMLCAKLSGSEEEILAAKKKLFTLLINNPKKILVKETKDSSKKTVKSKKTTDASDDASEDASDSDSNSEPDVAGKKLTAEDLKTPKIGGGAERDGK